MNHTPFIPVLSLFFSPRIFHYILDWKRQKLIVLPPRLSPFHGLIDTTPYRVAGHLLFSRDFLFLLLPDETVGVTEAIGWMGETGAISQPPEASIFKVSSHYEKQSLSVFGGADIVVHISLSGKAGNLYIS